MSPCLYRAAAWEWKAQEGLTAHVTLDSSWAQTKREAGKGEGEGETECVYQHWTLSSPQPSPHTDAVTVSCTLGNMSANTDKVWQKQNHLGSVPKLPRIASMEDSGCVPTERCRELGTGNIPEMSQCGAGHSISNVWSWMTNASERAKQNTRAVMAFVSNHQGHSPYQCPSLFQVRLMKAIVFRTW